MGFFSSIFILAAVITPCPGGKCDVNVTPAVAVLKRSDTGTVDPIVQAATLVSADKALVASTSASVASLQNQLATAQNNLAAAQTKLLADIAALNDIITPPQPTPLPPTPPTPPAAVAKLLYFYTPNCTICKQMDGLADSLQMEKHDCSTDKSYGDYKVTYVPTVIALKDGKETGRIVGAFTSDDIKALSK
jgi:hypothetical protein